MEYINYVIDNADAFATPFFVFVGVFIIAVGIRGFVYRLLARWARKTVTRVDDATIKSTRGPSLLWCAVVGIQIAVGTSQLNPQIISYSHKLLGALIAVSVSLVLANVAAYIVRHYSGKSICPQPDLPRLFSRLSLLHSV